MNIVGPDESEKNSCRAGENVKLKLSGVEEDVSISNAIRPLRGPPILRKS